MSLSEKQTRFLRQKSHHLKPVVIVGQAGISEGVINEIDQALEAHELIKVRVNAADKAQRNDYIQSICEQTGADRVQAIGYVASLYRRRRNRPATIQLPRA